MTIANYIVVLRIILIPVLIALLVLLPDYQGRLWSALFFLVLAFSDWLDGYLARKTRTVTSLGKLIDPLSDKLLVVSVLIVLLGFGEINFWPVLIIVFRELAVEGLRSLQMMKRVVVGASFLGKVKTVLQMMAVLFLILKLPFSNLILWLAVALTILSGLDYLMDLVQ